MPNYIVATIKPWNIEAFHSYSKTLPGNWTLITEPGQLTPALIDSLQPEFIFFPHWSWHIPNSVYSKANCILFHMTDLPFGRGGSPLQNLIAQGLSETKLSAIKVEAELDNGDVYLKAPLSLSGSAQQIFARMAELSWQMITQIIQEKPEPRPQQGQATYFTRRKPEQSQLPDSFNQLYDHIRMLDADSYPTAYLDIGDYRLEFSDAKPTGSTLEAKVKITKRD